MTVLMEPDVLARDSIRDAIGSTVDTVASSDELTVRVRDDADLATVILGPNVDLDLALDFAERMRRTNPTLGVVLVRRRIDAARPHAGDPLGSPRGRRRAGPARACGRR